MVGLRLLRALLRPFHPLFADRSKGAVAVPARDWRQRRKIGNDRFWAVGGDNFRNLQMGSKSAKRKPRSPDTIAKRLSKLLFPHQNAFM